MKPLKIITGICFSAILLSFTFGGDRYVVKLGNQQLVEQFVTRNASLPAISIPAKNLPKTFSVHYSECGRIGTDRALTLKNQDQRVLKVWRFDETDAQTMEISVDELVSAMSNQVNYLYYSSREHRSGQKLASIARAPTTTQ